MNTQAHMQGEHFLCQEPECVDCMTAFSTEDELRQHMLRVGVVGGAQHVVWLLAITCCN